MILNPIFSESGNSGKCVVLLPVKVNNLLPIVGGQLADHGRDSRYVVVGGTDEGKQALDWVLAQHSDAGEVFGDLFEVRVRL